MPEWLKIVAPLLGSLLAITLAALTAPVTASRWRLWQLDRLLSVLDKMDASDPAQPYVGAMARRKSAWFAATSVARLTRNEIGTVIGALWIGGLTAWSLLRPSPYDLLYYWWSKVPVIIGALLTLLWIIARRRWERVSFYNSLIAAGPREFSAMLHKKRRVPSRPDAKNFLLRFALLFVAPSEKSIDQVLEKAGVSTCPNGHPVGSSTLRIGVERGTNRRNKLVCARCLATLPRPSAVDVDEVAALEEAARKHRERKLAGRRKADADNSEISGTSKSG